MSQSSSPRGATVVVGKPGGLALQRNTFSLSEKGGKKHAFEAPNVRVGAGPGNDLILNDATVSSTHLEITATDRGFRIRDLDSTNGTFVGGVRIKEAFVEDGQEILAGEVPLSFKVAEETVSQPISEQKEFHGIVGQSPAMRAVFSRVERVAKSDATCLVHGETGTGKEVVAWAIYEASKRAQKPFVVVDCGAIARNLVESELFGHEKGAFTGAVARKIGAFERANGGTVFLDEIGELETELQPKLLRALERKEIQRVGGEKTIPVDVRIVAATNRDLRSMVATGGFREDLYYRLAVVTVELPPLRERKDDIHVLVDHFLEGMSAEKSDLPPHAMARFAEHNWPGNCRELKNAVERAVVLGETQFMRGGSGPASSSPSSSGSGGAAASPDKDQAVGQFEVELERPYKEQKASVVADFEERYARKLVRHHKGNVSAAARQAGIDRMSLHKILARYDLDPHDLAKS
jgi:transcriptional regulator with GAF, ATPase, and Fis domain